jgi:hypothetical protein
MLYRTTRPLLIDAIHAELPLDVETSDGSLHVEAGEWLVRNDDGALFACNAAYFARTFELVKSTKSLDDFDEGKPCGC